LKQADQNGPFPEEIELRLSAPLLAPRTLHFENHLRGRVNLGGYVGQVAPGRTVCFIREAGPLASASLDNHAMAGSRQLRDDVGNERNTTLAARDLAWNSYQHAFGFRGVINAP
jgi:hypothetical protein